MIDAPDSPLDLSIPQSDSESLESALALVLRCLSQAARPAVLIDMDVDRTGYSDALARLVEEIQDPLCVHFGLVKPF